MRWRHTEGKNKLAEFTEFRLTDIDDPITYRLKFDFNELAFAEELTGLNLLRPLNDLANISGRETRAILYALLKSAEPQVLLTEAGNLLTRDSDTVTRAILIALGVPVRPEEPKLPVDVVNGQISPD